MSSSSSSNSNESLTRGVRLLRNAQTPSLANDVYQVRFTVQAYDAHNMPNEIFRFLMNTTDPVTGDRGSVFDGVCSAVDIQNLPTSGPTSDETIPFFRLSSVDLKFRSQSEADDSWTIMKQEVTALVTSLNLMDKLVSNEIFVVGNPP